MTPLRVLLVTSEGSCGISDYGLALKESVEAADPAIAVIPAVWALDPERITKDALGWELLHLNHHDALHARWTAEHVRHLEAHGIPVVVTYHDTRSGEPGAENSEKARQLNDAASALIVHEPVADLPGAIYWRHGIPRAAQWPLDYNAQWKKIPDETRVLGPFKAFPQQPVLGTVGFNFPWKNYDRLCQLTAEEGWALVILSNDATAADEARWRGINPDLLCVRRFLPQPEAINYLAGCDATAFMYECANNGTSGAIRQGIAARKPVIARSDCRQNRDLFLGTETVGAIDWVRDWNGARAALQRVQPHAWQSEVSRVAHHDRWALRGRQHAALYRRLTGQQEVR